jgi:hypothetical protein
MEVRMTSPSGPSTPSQSIHLDGAIENWAKKGLAKYLEDVDLANELIEWLQQETGIRNRWLLRLAVKWLATLVGATARHGGGWLGGIAAQQFKRLLESMPFHSKIVAGMNKIAAALDRELASKQEFKEILAGHRPARDAEFAKSLTLDLQADVAQMGKIDDLGQDMAKGFRRLEMLLNPEPPLYLRLIEDVEETRFLYSAGHVPLLGRESELQALEKFLYCDHQFSWWMMTGPGGVGKSRLALEICRRHGMAWRAGFLPIDVRYDRWDDWHPSRPTLIIADYAGRRAEPLGSIARSLDQRLNLDNPVRLLLLERDANGRWLTDFTGTGTDRSIIESAQYGAPLSVTGLSEDELWGIVQLFAAQGRESLPQRAEVLEKLRELDPAGDHSSRVFWVTLSPMGGI